MSRFRLTRRPLTSVATGCDTLFLQLEGEFVVNDALELNVQPFAFAGVQTGRAFSPQDPIPMRTVNVMIPEEVNNNIESLHRALATTVEKLGCRACCSGFDILFQRELDLIAFDEQLGAQGFGRFK